MPRLNKQLKSALGASTTQSLSYNGTVIHWDANAPVNSLVNTPILGRHAVWLNDWTLVFESSQSGSARLYTYDTRTGVSAQVSASGADRLYAGGDVWAAWTSSGGYRDSLGRSHADYASVAVDDTGTVLIILDRNTDTGLGYLTKDANINAPVVITYDPITTAHVRNGVVVYVANDVLNRYVIDTGKFASIYVPVSLTQNDGDWVLGFHPNGLGLVVFEFGKLYGYRVNFQKNIEFNGDIRVSDTGSITVVTSTGPEEQPRELRKYTVDPSIDTSYYLFSTNDNLRTVSITAPPDTSVIGSDVITIGRNPDGEGQGFAKVITSHDWFNEEGGNHIRGAWQYDITAVVAQVGSDGSGYVSVKDSQGNVWVGSEVAHGIHCVAIRPDPTTSSGAPLWEVTWVRGAASSYGVGRSYARIILDDTLTPVGSLLESGNIAFGSQGFLDLDDDGEPIPTDENQYAWYGYVTIGLATTRGDWTIGQDASPTVQTDRLIAWNAATQKAYVVWNGYTNAQSRLALEYDVNDLPFPVVVPAGRSSKVVFSQFLPIGQVDVEIGTTPGILAPPLPIPSPSSTVPVSITPSELKSNTRVFRQPQSIPPTAKVLMAAARSSSPTVPSLSAAIAAGGAVAATLFGSGSKTMEEEAPAYNPQYPYNTVLMESESGHLIEVDDSPGAERVHVYHRTGSHIEMRPDGGVKYKTVKKRQDITIGDNEVYVAGDWNIVVEGGYTLHVRKGELVIDAKDGAAFNVKGNLKISADAIEMKASKKIFLNSPQVDIGGMSPGGMPMMSIPTGIAPYPALSIPPIFVPIVKMPLGALGQQSMSGLSKQIKDGKITPAAAQTQMAQILANTAVDAAGEPAFSTLTEQPSELPLSNPKLYSSAAVLASLGAGVATPLIYAKLRGRTLDTPDDVSGESYSAHTNLSVELGDYSASAKTSPGKAVQSDITPPDPEPRPRYAFNLPSGGNVRCTTGSNVMEGINTKFTEDLELGMTVTVDGTDAVIESIASDTSVILTAPWPAETRSSTLQVYRLRPMQEFFGKFKYKDTDMLGHSGLRLADMMVNFTSPVIEVPQINATMLSSSTGSASEEGECGNPDPTVQDPGIVGFYDPSLHNLTTVRGAGEWVEYVVNQLGPEWGHVTKTSGQNQWNGHAVDAIMYHSPTPLYNGKSYQVVDIINDAPNSNEPNAIVNPKPQFVPVCAPEAGPRWGGKINARGSGGRRGE